MILHYPGQGCVVVRPFSPNCNVSGSFGFEFSSLSLLS